MALSPDLNPLSERTCGFDSRPRHHSLCARRGKDEGVNLTCVVLAAASADLADLSLCSRQKDCVDWRLLRLDLTDLRALYSQTSHQALLPKKENIDVLFC